MNSAIGITDILIDAINKKYDSVRDLNSLNVNLKEENYEAMIPVIDSIIEDENNNIGKLQQLIDLLSNSEEDIEEGKQETIEIIDQSDEFVESITSMKKKLILSENFDNVIDDVQAVADPVFVGANEEHDENKKKYEDAMEENKKAAEDTVPDEEDTGKEVKSKELKAMHLSEDLFTDYSMARPGTTKVLDLVDEGVADPKEVLDELVRYLPDNMVKEFIDYYAENFLGIFEEDLNESIQCAIAKEQMKRFNEGKMPKNWDVDTYLKRLTEKKHITKKEAKSLKEWYSKNK